MHKLLLPLFIVASFCCRAQKPNEVHNNLPVATADTIEVFNGEFSVFQNGLIYSPHTVKQLTHIVDSLNLKFKTCDLNKPFLSLRQGLGYHVTINAKQAKQASKDMAAGMTLEAVLVKYSAHKSLDSFMVIISSNRYDKETRWEFRGLSFIDYADPKIYKKGDEDYNTVSLAKTWIAEEVYSKYELNAFYFKEEPRVTALPEKYARMVLYSECVIDTTTDIYTGANDKSLFYSSSLKGEKGYEKTKLFAFLNYIEKGTAHITEASLPKEYKNYKWRGIDSMRTAYVRAVLSTKEEFKIKLAEAVNEFKNGKPVSDSKFEYYVANYNSKKLALDMKRSRRVVGLCSMDQSPREHAQQIALLSAEAVNWETFLRAHLNIMNDRFDRVSDGSWSYAGRQTYIRELETLNLDVDDLLIGISLRSSNTAANHYYGDISRLGRAFAETASKEDLVNTLTTAIADEKLDSYNRTLLFYLLTHYTYNLSEKADRIAGYQLLLKARLTLPAYAAAKIQLKEQDFMD